MLDVAARLRLTCGLGLVGIPVVDSRCTGLLLAVRAYKATVGVLNIHDITFAHNVPAYILT